MKRQAFNNIPKFTAECSLRSIQPAHWGRRAQTIENHARPSQVVPAQTGTAAGGTGVGTWNGPYAGGIGVGVPCYCDAYNLFGQCVSTVCPGSGGGGGGGGCKVRTTVQNCTSASWGWCNDYSESIESGCEESGCWKTSIGGGYWCGVFSGGQHFPNCNC